MPSRSHLTSTDVFRESSIITFTTPDLGGPHAGDLDLRALLELACDWYWTLDASLRLVRLDGRQLDDAPIAMEAQLGRRPWEWAGVVTDRPGFVAMREALEQRLPFYEAICTMRDERGLLRYHVISGEPVHDGGRFVGFQGTTRDLTEQMRANALVDLEHAVTRRLAEAATSRKVLQAVMKVICESEQWETAGYFRTEDPTGTTRLIAGWSGPNMGSDATDFYRTTADKVIPAGGMLSRVIASAKPLWVANLEQSQTSWAQRVDATRERATFFVPVTLGPLVAGVLAFASSEIREPDERLLGTMRVIGEQVGQFLKRKEAEQVLRESEVRFRAMTHLSSDWYWEMGPDFRLTRVEGRITDDGPSLLADRSIGQRFWEMGLEPDDARWETHRAQLEARLPFKDAVMVQRLPGGRRVHISVSGEPMLDQRGQFVGYRGIARDISERREIELRIQHMATHDGLTGLPNRVLFGELLTMAIRACERSGGTMALLFVDLDRFKSINDTLGHDVGDALLKEMARRFAEGLRGSDVVARLGGDEFVVLLPQVDAVDGVATIAQKLIAAAARPVLSHGHEVCITASVGVSLYGVDAWDEHALMKHADLAMYAVKQQRKNDFRFYSPDLSDA